MPQLKNSKIKKIATMATMYKRRNQANVVVRRIAPQVDELIVVLNIKRWENLGDWISALTQQGKREVNLDNVTFLVSDNRLGDAERHLPVTTSRVYYFTLDDDLIYPNDYIDYLIQGIKVFRSVVTLHGKYYPRIRINHYYRDAGRVANVYRCLSTQDENYEVTVPGSGVMGWRGDWIDLRYELFREKNMADIEVARLAYQQRQRIVCLKHKEGYILYNDVGPDTIFNEQYNQCTRQTEIVNGILFDEFKRI